MYLEKINGPEDVKKIKIDELPVLAHEIRDALFMVYTVRLYREPLTRYHRMSASITVRLQW